MVVVKHQHVWRFGYGSNIGLTTLQQKKNLNPSKYLNGTIQHFEFYFFKGFPHVEPGWAGVRESSNPNAVLHGAAFYIPQEEADGLDKQEGGYDVLPCTFVSYEGEIVENVGLYFPKKTGGQEEKQEREEGIPSLRYLRLLQNGAKEAPLSNEWQEYLNSFNYYITPPSIRAQTNLWISEFLSDPKGKDMMWTSEMLSKHDGSHDDYPPHTSIMEYIIAIPNNMWVFSSWKAHNITRRNILQFNGKSLDTNDIRIGEDGFRPLPKMSECTDEEMEYVMQNLDSVLHRGGQIMARLKDFMDDQEE